MKWALFALSLLMVVIGALCVYVGYPIVELERGWALTLSGAFALTGSGVVLALGLVLARLESLAARFGAAREAPPATRAPGTAVEAEPVGAPESPPPSQTKRPAIADIPPPPMPRPAAPPPAPQSPAPPPVAPQPARPAAFVFPPAPRRARRPEPSPQASEAQAPPGDGDERTSEDSAPATEPPSAAGEASEIPPPPPAPPPKQDEPAVAAPVVQAPSRFQRFPVRSLLVPRGTWPQAPPSRQEPAQAVAGPANQEGGQASAESWFESALARLDEAPADKPPEATPEAAAPSESTPEPEEARTIPESGEEQGVIGRYESEGTTYIMYADGSIEARGASGVMRFESLTALKAHIEGIAG